MKSATSLSLSVYLFPMRRYMYFTEDFRLIPSARSVELKCWCFRLESESRNSRGLDKAQMC
jgi:hypothetical protein